MESPVHQPGRAARYTTANAEESTGGILTPLTWTASDRYQEAGSRAAWRALGALRSSELPVPPVTDEHFVTVVFGRCAVNVDVWGRSADRIPGTSGAVFEQHLFGSGWDTPRPLRARLRQYPVVAVKAPVALRRAFRRMPVEAPRIHTWWQGVVHDPTLLEDRAVAREIAHEIPNRIMSATIDHVVASGVGQALFDHVTAIAARAGHPGLELDLVTSTAGTDELRVAEDLWSVSRGALELDEFLLRHGYHGPDEHSLEAHSWRERPEVVQKLADSYAERPGSESPEARHTRRLAAHHAARARVKAASSPLVRPAIDPLLDLCGRCAELRELGRALLLRGVDAGRAIGRAQGVRLHRDGFLDDPLDAAMLTMDELLDGDEATFRPIVERRRREHAEFEAMELPLRWHGVPEPRARRPEPPAADNERDLTPLVGHGASRGVVEGIVTIVEDPAEDDLPEDGILVCHATDPSWVALFVLARAVVIDLGNTMSHGAVVARELGLPSVVGTGDGTTRLRTGDFVRVDGDAGRVEILPDRS